MNCNNHACLFNLGGLQKESELLVERGEISIARYVGECTAALDNVEPTAAPINRCPKFLKDGLQTGDEFAPWFGIDISTGWHLTKEQNATYMKDLTFVRDEMHRRTL